ncbi:MAG: polysaccharide deacetylase family protein [Rhizobiales bacterium]|nr:polysaccharide deacetylase family protein [Hyphomicrobiales bacterium]
MKLCLALAFAAAMADSSIAKECNNPNALGVARTVAIDTTGGPGFGFQHYKFYDFLEEGEVVLTFDDGPLPTHTVTILKALAQECVLATFFPVGKLAVGYPEVLKQVAAAGHTVGSHTWSHPNLGKKALPEAQAEIEKAVSAVAIALGQPGAPFFRFPFLKDSPETLQHLASRNIAMFSTDLDSFDFRGGKPQKMIERVMANLRKRGKGILLFHDIQPITAAAMAGFLAELKKGGFRIVHLTAKTPVTTIESYDEEIRKGFRGADTLAVRPLSSVVSTISD